MNETSDKVRLAFDRMFKTLGTMDSEEAEKSAKLMEQMIAWFVTLCDESTGNQLGQLDKGEK